MSTIAITPKGLHELAYRALIASRVSEANAESVAKALVAADVDGLGSHGVARIPAYSAQAMSGKVDGFALPSPAYYATSLVYVDAKGGFAFPAIELGLDAASERTSEYGVCVLVVAKSHHAGAMGYHVEAAANRGLIAIGFSNSPAAIAPWGGSEALFGTNPVAFAAPRRGSAPLVVDLSLSTVARGKVKRAAAKGEAVPGGWGFDSEGRETTNPEAILDAGTMAPVGGAKGAALALMVEVLTATLAGSNYAYEASSFFTDAGPSPSIAQTFILIDPFVISGSNFSSRLEELLTAILSQAGSRLPGERRLARRRDQLNGTIDIDADVLQSLQRLTSASSV